MLDQLFVNSPPDIEQRMRHLRKTAAAVLATRAFKAAVDADWNLSREKAITAAPTFVMNQDKLVGAQPCEMLVKLMDANGVKKKGKNRK